MMSMKGDGKPVSFIEDCAVALPDLADYTERLNDVFARHGTKGTWYAHASVGCLHVRPVLNMKDRRGRGEDARHRRGMLRPGPRIQGQRTPASMATASSAPNSTRGCSAAASSRAFEQVKDAFDPAGMLNPGKSCARRGWMTAACSATARIMPPTRLAPALDWSAWPGPQGGLLGAVEMCNNNGTCRKSDANVMCPSFRATQDEQHLTRGRANTLRLALTGQLARMPSPRTRSPRRMALCVSCKGCRRECPTGVDMAKLKIEVQARPRPAPWAVAEGPHYRRPCRAGRPSPPWRPSPQCPRLGPGLAACPNGARLRRRPQPAALPHGCLP